MKKFINRILCVAVGIGVLGFSTLTAQAKCKLIVDDRDPFVEPKLIRATCYTSSEGAITYSGQRVRPGIIAGPKDWLGSVALLYSYKTDEEGNYIPDEFLGFYEVLDTGAGMDTDGDGRGDSIKRGLSIDIYQPTMADAYKFRDMYGDYLMIFLVEGEG